MTTEVICVTGDVSLETATALMLERGVSGLPVVNDEGVPIGILSKTDVVRDRYENGDTHEFEHLRLRDQDGREIELERGLHAQRLRQPIVAEVMTPLAFTMPETAAVSQAAALMSLEGIHRIPVVRQDGTVVGILSSLDILRYMARRDGFLNG